MQGFTYPSFSSSVIQYVCVKSNSLTYNIKHIYHKTALMPSNCHDFPSLKALWKILKILMFHQSTSKETPMLVWYKMQLKRKKNLRSIIGLHVHNIKQPQSSSNSFSMNKKFSIMIQNFTILYIKFSCTYNFWFHSK